MSSSMPFPSSPLCIFDVGGVLTDGAGGSVDAVMGMAINQYQKSRTTPFAPRHSMLLYPGALGIWLWSERQE